LGFVLVQAKADIEEASPHHEGYLELAGTDRSGTYTITAAFLYGTEAR
jgi:hypothetical protein